MSKLDRMIACAQPSCQNESFANTSRRLLENRNETFPLVRYFHMETRVSLRYFVSYCLCKLFIDSEVPQTLSNVISLTILLTLSPFTLFEPKIRAIK